MIEFLGYFEISSPCNIFSFHHLCINFYSRQLCFELIIEDSWLFKFHHVYWDVLRKIFFHLKFRVVTSLLLDSIRKEYIVRKWIESYELGRYEKFFHYLWNSTQDTLWSTQHSIELHERMILCLNDSGILVTYLNKDDDTTIVIMLFVLSFVLHK